MDVSLVKQYAEAAGFVLAESLWPTKCAICERYGESLCDECRRSLSYIDQWRACAKCAAPFGKIQCTECNPVAMGGAGLAHLSFDACVCAVFFDERSAKVVRAFKDGGQRDLARAMAYAIACAIPPLWVIEATAIVPVSSTRKARKTRGFDHCHELSSEVASLLGKEWKECLRALPRSDQRELGRLGRFRNMKGVFSFEGASPLRCPLVIDDVMTTGATLNAASAALRGAGSEKILCATFARVY